MRQPAVMTESWEFLGGHEGVLALAVPDVGGEPEVHIRIYMPPHPMTRDADAAFELRHYTYEWLLAGHEGRDAPLWVVSGQLRRRDREWVIVRVSVSQEWPDDVDVADQVAPVTARVLREVRLGLVHSAMAALANQLPEDPRLPFSEMQEMVGPELADGMAGVGPIERPRKGRPRRSAAELRRFAQTFIDCQGSYRRTSRHLDWPEETVKTWLKAARAEGWLARGHPGRRGAPMPGPRLLEYRRSAP